MSSLITPRVKKTFGAPLAQNDSDNSLRTSRDNSEVRFHRDGFCAGAVGGVRGFAEGVSTKPSRTSANPCCGTSA